MCDGPLAEELGAFASICWSTLFAVTGSMEPTAVHATSRGYSAVATLHRNACRSRYKLHKGQAVELQSRLRDLTPTVRYDVARLKIDCDQRKW